MTSRTRKTLAVRIGDRTYQVSSDDDYLDNLGGVFEPDSVELIQHLCTPGGVSLDIGANIGCTALLLSQFSGKTIAFEPSPSTFDLLKTNLDAAAVRNVDIVNAGLGAEPADLSIVFNPSNRSGGFVTDKPLADHAVESINILNGDAYLQKRYPGTRIDFVKIDVEGFELHVLDGLRATIEAHRPVVTLELNHWCLNAFQRMSVPDFLDALRERFPILYAVGRKDTLDLHDPRQAYRVMHEHIVKFDYPALVAAFEPAQIGRFLDRYVHNAPEYVEPVSPSERVAELSKILESREELLREIQAARAAESQAAQARIEQLQRDMAAEIDQLAQTAAARESALQSTIDRIHRSHSWKITAPLRAMRRRLG